MIRTETLIIDNREFTHTWSDEGRYVVRDNIAYEDACDPSEFGRTYTEGDLIPIEPEQEQPEQDPYAIAGRIMMGVEP